MSFHETDTIVAIATPPGRGGIGVVRVAGPEALAIVQRLLPSEKTLEPRHATFTVICDSSGSAESRGRPVAVDQAVVTWFAAPLSYTGDDVVEISAHGSPVLLQRIVELAMQGGARLAEPGEFTLRAYLNGKLDLVQAEAVRDLVDAVTPRQARAAMDQLEGTLTLAIGQIERGLFDLAARLEASLDFPEEGFHFVTRADARADVERIQGELLALVRQGRQGRVLREGRTVVITGPPNAGKSSLFNALAGAARAIVTEVPGTTRDVLTERVDMLGVPVTLVDTAGLREARDAIEAEGVSRARQARGVAALTLIVFDRSGRLSAQDRAIVSEVHGPAIVVLNKCDLAAGWGPDEMGAAFVEATAISATAGHGLDALRARVVGALAETAELRDTPAITNARHIALLQRSAESLGAAADALDSGHTEELVLTLLASAREPLEEIRGRRTVDDLLQHIFATFCVGK